MSVFNSSAKWICGHENHCSLPQHGDFILTALCRVGKSRAGVIPDVLSLSLGSEMSLFKKCLFKQFLESLMEEVRELGISSAPGSSQRINPPCAHKAAPLPQHCPRAQPSSQRPLSQKAGSFIAVFLLPVASEEKAPCNPQSSLDKLRNKSPAESEPQLWFLFSFILMSL